jgi:fido (protein-threonine AMPylation protein)
MPLSPEYGETLLPDDELVFLLPDIRAGLTDPIAKADIYLIEEAAQADVVARLLPEVSHGDLTLDSLLSVDFVQELHRQLYGGIWTWGGEFRKHNTNVGIDWYQITVNLHTVLSDILYRWSETDDWTAHELGIAVHAATVRIHPFADGNGRTTRQLADFVFVAAQDGDNLEQYDWDIDKRQYIALLKEYDSHRDPRVLAEFIHIVAT